MSTYDIQVTSTPKVNLAYYQNSVPVLHELVVLNEGEESLEEIELALSSEPAFIKPKKWIINTIAAGQRFHIKDLDVTLDGALLGRLTEAETAQLNFVLRTGGEEIARSEKPMELLARNQWGGIDHMPEMIAAFVQPNEPAVEHLLKRAADILRKHGKNSALNGYEGGRRRVWELSSAIWAAIGSMGIDYAQPPASFERYGQKIRGPGQITEAGIATCTDTTLFMCAAMEQCGLNPLIIFTREHAFAGVWLNNEEFTTIVVDDITALRKRVKLNDLILFETTLVTQRPCPGFGRAVEMGVRHISEADEEKFELAVDVRRARMHRIKPLASEKVVTPLTESAEPEEKLENVFDEAIDLLDEEIVREEAPESTQHQDRLERWQRKLLDLSLRNSLLNFKVRKRTIKLEAPNPGRLEDLLAGGEVLKLLPHPDLMDGDDLRSQAIYESRTNEDIRREHALDALKRKEVMVNLPKDDLDGRLVELYRFARTTLQEGGANSLFLALGFLSWTRSDKDTKPYRAPLILIPVTLQRKSIRSGYKLKLHDDEPRFNPTLIEMLRQDFNLELNIEQGELPRDDHGLDIDGIWRKVVEAIKNIPGWEVVEDVVLSIFSFSKYLMWKDMVDRIELLKQNSVVKHLVDTPHDQYPLECDFPAPQTLDSKYSPDKIFCPLPADSSQLSAVIGAASGNDFVLIGPPGTGKSQTIANLIAQCLAEKKTVLFVSQKIAALNVVHRRLSEVGLDDFCLELHSNKANKSDVIQRLGRAWDTKVNDDAINWQAETQRLKALRDKLNEFVKQLHRKRHNGLTAYIAIGRIVAGRDMPKLGLSWPSADIHDAESLFALENFVEELDINAQQIDNIADSPLSLILHDKWSPAWQQSMINAARELAQTTEGLIRAEADFLKVTNFPEIALDERGRDGLLRLSRVLPEAAGCDWRFTLRPDVRTIVEELQNGLKLLLEYTEIKNKLSVPWSTNIIHKARHGLDLIARHGKVSVQLSAPYLENGAKLDAEQLKEKWEKTEKSWWPFSWLRRSCVRSTLAKMVKGKQKLELPADIERLIELRRLETEINNLRELSQETSNLWAGLLTQTGTMVAALAFQDALSSALAKKNWTEDSLEMVATGQCGAEMAADLKRMKLLKSLENEITKLDYLQEKVDGLWDGLNSDNKKLEGALAFQEALSCAISKMAKSVESLSYIKSSLEILLGESNNLLEATGPVPSAGRTYRKAFESFQAAGDGFAAIAGTTISNLHGAASDTLEELSKLCRGIIQSAPKLRVWCTWRKTRGKAYALGLEPLVKAIENGGVELGKVSETFLVDYARWWLGAVVDDDETLRNFVSATHEKYIADFRTLDDRYLKLTRDYIRAGLCNALPGQHDISRNSELGVLRHELQKKRRHLPLRELMNRMPNTITKLTPCLLMSPLSIAQYLSTETANFDVVVFDEASQIPVWDAIGAIARGKQVIIVGDQKQLPPTSFFDRAESDFDYEDVEGDLESILDECIGASLPVRNLSWHYRSRHESLIAFSNRRYYNGRLVTFPSPVTNDRAVRLLFVTDGVYEKGKTRTNLHEARALVGHIVSRLRDPDFINSPNSPKTIGVVTFNAEQQRLIEDLLDSERRKGPSIERFFADADNENNIEPIFVKNLESVQGDERDIMYFSLTYGPDLTGAVSMNFGPMNRAGGERRLNVAITRARHELLVFSSLKPEQIDLSRTQAVGVKDLKHFMEFADRGSRAIAEAVQGSVGDYESPFEQAVAEALASRGWLVHPQVGVSSFRIDLGVVDPDAPGSYLAGVECDGATYHRSATARDRDKLREQVLRDLGWKIIRIWSSDWWIDAAGELEKVDSRLKVLLDRKRVERAQKESEKKQQSSNPSESGGNNKEDGSLEPVTTTEDENETIQISPEPLGDTLDSVINDGAIEGNEPERLYAHPASQTGNQFFQEQYVNYDGSPLPDPRTVYNDVVSDGLCDIIEVEGPILAKRAYDIFLRSRGIKRLGRDLRSIMNKALHHAIYQGRVVSEDEWGEAGMAQMIVRITGSSPIILRKGGGRSLDEIPPSEVLVASNLFMKNAAYQKGSDEHLRAILKGFDLRRLTPHTQQKLLQILEMNFEYAEAEDSLPFGEQRMLSNQQELDIGVSGSNRDDKKAGQKSPANIQDYKRGMRVLHKTFGSGTIIDVSPNNRHVVVRFDDGSQRKLVARLARLSSVNGG